MKVHDAAIIKINSGMCEDAGCPSRKNCFRHAASGRVPMSEQQPYFAEPTRDPDARFCPWYWPVTVPGLKRPRLRRVSVLGQYSIKNDPAQLKTFLSASEVATMLSIPENGIKRLVADPKRPFPQPMKLGNRKSYWLRTEIEAFIRSVEVEGVGIIGGNRRSWVGAKEGWPAWPWTWEG